jgi:ABC-type phosphate transport system substrate-binding protein
VRAAAVVATIATALAAWPAADGAGAGAAFAVIVSPDVAGNRLTRNAAELIFRRKQSYWSDGVRAQPVNLPASSALREAFSECILGEAPAAMESYWREMYFHGVLPPHVVDSERAVILYVNATPGAIGYVSSCPKDVPVNVVLTVGDVPNCARHPVNCTSPQDS